MSDMKENQPHCGYVAIIGRPNVGKSTLLNHLIQQKISITSKKPQTTRHQILGIRTVGHQQIIYIDTPGLHQDAHRALNRYMNRAATSVIFDMNLILFVVDGLHWTPDDEWALKKITHAECPVILVVNKVDKIAEKEALLPYLQTLNQKREFAVTIPLCAKSKEDAHRLEAIITHYLPEGPFIFPEDQMTDKSQRFLAAEIIREKLMRHLGQELPYDIAVEIEEFKEDARSLGSTKSIENKNKKKKKTLFRISAVIYVQRPGQKKIVIGDGGAQLKEIGQKARLDMEKLFEHRIFLTLWVKVKRGWADNERSLKSLGF